MYYHYRHIIGAPKNVLCTEVICIVSFIWRVLYWRFHCSRGKHLMVENKYAYVYVNVYR